MRGGWDLVTLMDFYFVFQAHKNLIRSTPTRPLRLRRTTCGLGSSPLSL